MSGNTIQITPVLPVTDMNRAIAFFGGVLGFAPYVASPGYAYLSREGAAIRLMHHAITDGSFKAATAYIEVNDLGILCDQLVDALARLPEGRVVGPVDQADYQRELYVRDPDGNLIIFGQLIPAAPGG